MSGGGIDGFPFIYVLLENIAYLIAEIDDDSTGEESLEESEE